MVNASTLHRLLIEGRQINMQNYYRACQTYSGKTFYLLIELLMKRPVNVSIGSDVLRNYIIAAIKANGIAIDKKFNPEGWFGNQWTTGLNDGNWSLFRKEYTEILVRSPKSPYYYRVKPEYYEQIKTIMQQIENTNDFLVEESEPSRTKVQDIEETSISLAPAVEITGAVDYSVSFGLERDLQRYIRMNIGHLEEGLKIVDYGKERTTATGRIDICAEDNKGSLVIIELKAGRAPDTALTQILGYMSSEENNGHGSIRGILVAEDFSPQLLSAVRWISNVKLVKYSIKFQFENTSKI
jgi:hypothetical protein